MLGRVTIILNDVCNSMCDYCYENRESVSLEEVKPSSITYFLGFVYNNFTIAHDCILEIIGGEPSLYNMWRDVVSIINNSKFNRVKVFTNGKIYIPELKDIIVDDTEIKIALNNSNSNIVEKYKRDGLQVTEYFILNKKNLHQRPHDKPFLFTEYTNNAESDLSYDDVYHLTTDILVSGETVDQRLFYVSKAMVGDMMFGSNSGCFPFVEEIAIRYDDKVVPCSRCKGIPIELDLYSPNLYTEIREMAHKLVNIDVLGKTNGDLNCLECPLQGACQPCLMIKNDTLMTDRGLIHSFNKCEYERMICKAQLDAYQDFKKGSS